MSGWDETGRCGCDQWGRCLVDCPTADLPYRETPLGVKFLAEIERGRIRGERRLEILARAGRVSTRLSAEELDLGPMESAAFDGRTTSETLRSMVGVLVAEARSLIAERDNARAESVRLREALRGLVDAIDAKPGDATADDLAIRYGQIHYLATTARALLESETPQ